MSIPTIKIQRYEHGPQAGYLGYIEPEDLSWIIYLDEDGRPGLYYPHRENNGAVINPPINLASERPGPVDLDKGVPY